MPFEKRSLFKNKFWYFTPPHYPYPHIHTISVSNMDSQHVIVKVVRWERYCNLLSFFAALFSVKFRRSLKCYTTPLSPKKSSTQIFSNAQLRPIYCKKIQVATFGNYDLIIKSALNFPLEYLPRNLCRVLYSFSV